VACGGPREEGKGKKEYRRRKERINSKNGKLVQRHFDDKLVLSI